MDAVGAVTFLGRSLPPGFERRVMTIAPGGDRAADVRAWPDALVVVERGAIQVELDGGARARFARGDLLWLRGLRLRALRNAGPEPAVIVAVHRRDAHPDLERTSP
jgi:hypothetical protein